jgi:4-alpha-glucanotransferase
VVVPLQDFFAIDSSYRITDPALERINIPGLVLDTNWTYKIPCAIETLLADKVFTMKIKTLTDLRK